MIHNGIIENYAQLKTELLRKGYVFSSDTDTEVLLNFIEDIKKNNDCPLEEAVRIALKRIVGAYVIVLIDNDNPHVLIAADVILKERKKLICVIRDTPYNLIHIKNMETVTLAGGIICPATPSFYSQPQTIEAAALTVVDRVIDIVGLKNESFRWGG